MTSIVAVEAAAVAAKEISFLLGPYRCHTSALWFSPSVCVRARVHTRVCEYACRFLAVVELQPLPRSDGGASQSDEGHPLPCRECLCVLTVRRSNPKMGARPRECQGLFPAPIHSETENSLIHARCGWVSPGHKSIFNRRAIEDVSFPPPPQPGAADRLVQARTRDAGEGPFCAEQGGKMMTYMGRRRRPAACSRGRGVVLRRLK